MTEKHAIKRAVACVIFIILVTSSTAATIDNDKATKVVKESPIVINTVAQHYQNPTLGEYQLCTKSRDECLSKCGSINESCKSTCPVCPILIDQDVLIQGINDTLYRLPINSGKVNQTNIIRLTNEIRNIIETSMGNITANNQNNINIYQNSSRTGGKFGLGYNEKGSCCHVIEPRRCRRSITGPICGHRRQRTCGSQCISRVIRAKRVVTCSEINPDDCNPSIEYLPQPRRPGCQYTSTYPYISCRSATHNAPSSTNCGRCYSIPYINVMRGEVSRSCLSCFGRSASQRRSRPVYQPVYQPAPTYYGGPYAMYPPYQTYYHQPSPPPPPPPPQLQPQLPIFNRNNRNDWAVDDEDLDDFELPRTDNGWKVEARKCVTENGTVTENCPPEVTEEDDFSQLSHDGDGPIEDEYETGTANGWDYDYGDDIPQLRHRYRRNNHF